jgi:hypothetical protein
MKAYQNNPNHQQAHPDDGPMDESGLEGVHTGQAIGSPLEVDLPSENWSKLSKC